MIKKVWNFKLARFLTIGGINTLLDFLMFNTYVFALHLPILVGNTLSVCVGVSLSYIMNHKFVFRHSEKLRLKPYLQFFLITGLSVVAVQSLVIILSKPLLHTLIHQLLVVSNHGSLLAYQDKLALNASKALAVLVGLIWNYILYSKIVFKFDVGNEPSI